MRHTIEETIARLRKHPVIAMDKQNVTGDAADLIEELSSNFILAREYLEIASRDLRTCSDMYVLSDIRAWAHARALTARRGLEEGRRMHRKLAEKADERAELINLLKLSLEHISFAPDDGSGLGIDDIKDLLKRLNKWN